MENNVLEIEWRDSWPWPNRIRSVEHLKLRWIAGRLEAGNLIRLGRASGRVGEPPRTAPEERLPRDGHSGERKLVYSGRITKLENDKVTGLVRQLFSGRMTQAEEKTFKVTRDTKIQKVPYGYLMVFAASVKQTLVEKGNQKARRKPTSAKTQPSLLSVSEVQDIIRKGSRIMGLIETKGDGDNETATTITVEANMQPKAYEDRPLMYGAPYRVILKTSYPPVDGEKAWVEVDGKRIWVEVQGKRMADWKVGAKEVEFQLNSGSYRISVYLQRREIRRMVFSRQITLAKYSAKYLRSEIINVP